MRTILTFSLWLLAFASIASDTLRVGNRLLVAGDSAAQVRELLGPPARVARHRARRHGRGIAVVTPASESWIYRDGEREITVTLVDGEARRSNSAPETRMA